MRLENLQELGQAAIGLTQDIVYALLPLSGKRADQEQALVTEVKSAYPFYSDALGLPVTERGQMRLIGALGRALEDPNKPVVDPKNFLEGYFDRYKRHFHQ